MKAGRKYKTVLKLENDEYINEKIDWLDANSNGSIKIKMSKITGPTWVPQGCQRVPEFVYIGFEKEDDATFFRIKYAV